MACVYIIILFLGRFAVSIEHYALYQELFLDQDYNSKLRPVKKGSQAVEVLLEYHLSSVDDLDETNEFFSTTGWLKIMWRDEFLTWNMSRFDDLEKIELPAENVWCPDLVLSNNKENSIRVPQQDSMIILFSNGSIIWWVAAYWQTKCRINVNKFPFDSQTCPIIVSQLATDNKKVLITGQTNGRIGLSFKSHGEWDVTNLSLETTMDNYDGYLMSRITVNVVLTRRPLYHIVTYMLPVASLSVLNLATFLVPVECGEKISLCVAVLLSYAVFLSSITSNLPKVSDMLSIFGIYLLVMLIVKVTSCFIAVIVVRAHVNRKVELERFRSETIKTNDVHSQKVTSMDKATKINWFCFYVILSLTAIITAGFISWMAIGL